MFEQLRRIFSFGDPLVELARAGDPSLFKKAFCSSEVYVVSTPVDRSLDPDSMSADELTDLLDAAVWAAGDDAPVAPFTYGPESDRVLPVFSCEGTAEAFVEAYVKAAHRVIPFVISSLEGASLLPLLGGPVRMALNPLTDSEFDLPAAVDAELRA